MSGNDITIEAGNWDTLSEACSHIRRVVFIDEQGVDESEELDALDPTCIHFLIRDGQMPCGTARLLPDGHIGRVAIFKTHRGLGLGARLMRHVIEHARTQHFTECALSAQTHATGFYEQLGFVAHGEVYIDAGIPHRAMTLRLA
ncbi:GNAT family N-acetyltransferase [Kushneria marisflavi]|uniref:GNAT family N-acetyltransferase n=1 Tax=Kushneria marisflavi TaxID=157779 RepID=A0A240URH4_9GAMM|nr:GNAT family N-acetyltransferase [Kushneria marisflavi]ART64084.1 GNAT family N-acetyltransferase [Kushneria marisflavi]RKD85823.1 putative GNAT family N-acyltransferase [Kushneria marisflavi]